MYIEVGPDPADLEAFREAAQDVRQILPNRSAILLPRADLCFLLVVHAHVMFKTYTGYVKTRQYRNQDADVLKLLDDLVFWVSRFEFKARISFKRQVRGRWQDSGTREIPVSGTEWRKVFCLLCNLCMLEKLMKEAMKPKPSGFR